VRCPATRPHRFLGFLSPPSLPLGCGLSPILHSPGRNVTHRLVENSPAMSATPCKSVRPGLASHLLFRRQQAVVIDSNIPRGDPAPREAPLTKALRLPATGPSLHSGSFLPKPLPPPQPSSVRESRHARSHPPLRFSPARLGPAACQCPNAGRAPGPQWRPPRLDCSAPGRRPSPSSSRRVHFWRFWAFLGL